MSNLFTLSPELLIQIFVATDDVRDALRLSASSQQLRAVWLEHSSQTIEGVLRATFPAYEKAVDLVVTETRLESGTDDSPSLLRCLPTLLRTADLRASACLAYSAFREDAPSPPVSYYFLRRVGLGYEHRQIRNTLYDELRAISKDALMPPAWMSHWLLQDASFAEQVRQGVDFEECWHNGARNPNDETETEWEYGCNCIRNGAIWDINHGTNHLPNTIQGYDIWGRVPRSIVSLDNFSRFPASCSAKNLDFHLGCKGRTAPLPQ